MNLQALLEKSQPVPESGCFIWDGYVNEKGYGRTQFEGKLWLAHRLAWKFAYGICPDDKMVCHKCDIPSCINPEHLFLGTAAENNEDRDRKGRWTHNKGEKHGMAKLTESDVIDIRQCLKDGIELETIAAGWGVTKSMIGLIKNGRNWKHLGGKIHTFHEYSDDELYAHYKAAREELQKRGIGEA